MQGPLGPGGYPDGVRGLGIFDSFGDGMMRMGGPPPMNVPGGSRGSKVPKARNNEDDDERYTTVMLRNIPNKYTRGMLIEQLHRTGFRGDIDYLYLPTDFANKCNVGYCFLNLRTPLARARFTNAFDGVAAQSCLPGFNSYKVCQVTKAKWQGREENVRRLRSGPELMAQLAAHPEWLPLLLDEEGNQEHFALDEDAAGPPVASVPRRQRGKRQGPGAGPVGPLGPGAPWPLAMNGLVDVMQNAMKGGRGRGSNDRGGGRRRRGGGRGALHGPGSFMGAASSGSGFGVPMAAMPMMTEQGMQYVPYDAAGAYGEAGSYFFAYPAMAPDQQIYGMPYQAGYPGFPAGYDWQDDGEGFDNGVPPRQFRNRGPGIGLAGALLEADLDEEEDGDLQD